MSDCPKKISVGLVVNHVTVFQAVTSGPAWCLAADKAGSRLACGTEEGFVCLFRIVSADSQPEYERVLDRQEGRILCLAWHPAGMHIATGSADTVRVWDTQTGHPTARSVNQQYV